MSKRNVKELLRGVPFFAECSEKDLAQVSRLTTTVSVPAGKAVASQGALGQEFFVIVEGTVTVAINDRTVAESANGVSCHSDTNAKSCMTRVLRKMPASA